MKQTDEVSRQREAFGSERSALEAERASFEREQVGLKDRERAVSEGQLRLEKAEAEAEETRSELAKRIEETGEYRRQLAEKAARLSARKERLAEDASTVDERIRSLDAESEKLQQERESCRADQHRLGEDRERFDADRRELERQQKELEQSRRTFQAGLRNLEERQGDVADREAAIGERANELEVYRDRLEEEFAELGRQREELLGLQAEHSDSAESVRTLMDRAEARQKEAADREEAARAYEEALSARAAELARAEKNFEQQTKDIESRRRELSADAEALERERKEFESGIASEREELENLRQRGEEDLAAGRAELDRQHEETKAAIAAEREAIRAEEVEAENTATEEARRKLEEELSERLAAAARKEEEVQQRCKARLAELDADIEQRLEQMEEEIRRSRGQADREITERQRAHEEEVQESQSRLDEQLADLRVRQAAVAQEQSLLRMRQRELDAEQRAALLSRGRDDEDATIEDMLPAVHIHGHGEEAAPDDELSLAALEDRGDAQEVDLEPKVELDVAASVETDIDAESDEIDDGAEDETPTVGLGAVPGESPEQEPVAFATEPAAAEPRPARRFRPVLTGVVAALVGCLLAVVWMWTPTDDVVVVGQLVVEPDDASGRLTAKQHHARMVSPQTLEAASRLAGVDLDGMYRRDGRIDLAVAQSGDALELRARATKAEQAEARRWLEAWAAAYEESLRESVVSQSQRKERLARLEEGHRKLSEDLQTAEANVQAIRDSLETDPGPAGVESSRAAKERLKAELIDARAEVDAAEAALAEFLAEPEPTEPIVPTPEQFAEAYASDMELMQAVEERDANAGEFHSALTQAMSESQVPLSTLLTAISTIVSEVDKQLAAQPDKEIQREIEEVAVDLRDYLAQAEEFSMRWDDLAPKVGTWKNGGDADLLLEYQKKAESLIREFHAGSRKSFGDAAKKIDAIGRGGSEMTKRRVIQNQLLKASHACLEARNEWIIAARGAVPRYNLELKALRNAIRDITPRVTERRRHHQQRLAEQLLKARSDERVARGQRLQERESDAVQRHQQLSDRFLKLDAAVAEGDAGFDAELQQRQRDLREQEDTVARLRRELATTDREMQRLSGSEEVSLAGVVSYRSLAPLVPSRFDPEKRAGAAAVGGTAAVLLMFGAWVLTRTKRSTQDR
ncbi:MAG: hypothetical protein ABII12_06235 [Planctomycetota bacterium]